MTHLDLPIFCGDDSTSKIRVVSIFVDWSSDCRNNDQREITDFCGAQRFMLFQSRRFSGSWRPINSLAAVLNWLKVNIRNRFMRYLLAQQEILFICLLMTCTDKTMEWSKHLPHETLCSLLVLLKLFLYLCADDAYSMSMTSQKHLRFKVGATILHYQRFDGVIKLRVECCTWFCWHYINSDFNIIDAFNGLT